MGITSYDRHLSIQVIIFVNPPYNITARNLLFYYISNGIISILAHYRLQTFKIDYAYPLVPSTTLFEEVTASGSVVHRSIF